MNNKLSDADVRVIRRRLADGISRATLAREYGLATETIAKIHRGDTFRWVTEEVRAVPTDLEMQASQARLLALSMSMQAQRATVSPPADSAEPAPELEEAATAMMRKLFG